MEIQLIRKLVRLMTGGDLSELEVEDRESGLRVHLKRGGEAPSGVPMVNVMQGATTGAAPAALPAGTVAGGALGAEPDLSAGTPFPSPLVGTFYRSASPDSDAFVEVGSKVGPDTVLCIVEAMKVMNEIKGDVRGEILEVLVENGEPVEYGQPLFLLKSI
ncbi:MAG: acetyl-CoA carboxylase biotin carboxyl carrier protein [Planctomycetota bacterium]|jgi:acetyl-CoA carboxylase biotin carboxyl carrier protein